MYQARLATVCEAFA
jgi:hypothetical protein